MPEIFVLKAAITFHEFHSHCSFVFLFFSFFFLADASLALYRFRQLSFLFFLSDQRNTCSFYFLPTAFIGQEKQLSLNMY